MKHVVFCGVGALGSQAAVLCRELPIIMRFVDFDIVASKNLKAQAFTKQSLGKNKAESLRLQMLNFWGVQAEARPVRLTHENVGQLCGDANLTVDCFDNAASRRELCTWKKLKMHKCGPLLHAGMSGDGTFGLVRWNEHFKPDEEGTPGAATCEGGEHLPFIGLVAAALAGVIRDFVERGIRRDVIVAREGVTTTWRSS
jgi:molybdopterin-synthase adenylyltransferase